MSEYRTRHRTATARDRDNHTPARQGTSGKTVMFVRYTTTFVLLIWVLVAGCGGNDETGCRRGSPPPAMVPGQERLADGFYEILEEVTATGHVQPADQTGQLVTSDFGTYYVRTVPDVSLRLAVEPEPGTGEFESTGIDLILVEDEAPRLERLTRASVGKRILIIVEGVVVSAPEVRGVVPGPVCQIHCIDEDRRNDVLGWLMDNVED